MEEEQKTVAASISAQTDQPASTSRPHSLDKSLDEIIKERKPVKNRDYRQRHKPAVNRPSNSRYRNNNNNNNNNVTISIVNDKYDKTSVKDHADACTIIVSNLFHKATQEDLYELFQSIGSVVKVRLEYDRAGRSNGIARVVFSDRRLASMAVDKFHHVPLDGYPMQISLLTPTSGMHNRDRDRHSRNRNNSHGRGRNRSRSRSHSRTRTRHAINLDKEKWEKNTFRSDRKMAIDDSNLPSKLDAELDDYMMKQ